jgi:GMP synthase-like glutamine amidotransferase
MKKKRRPKILIILMYSNRALNNINICRANFKKSIRNARLIFRNWYDEQGIAKLLNNIGDKLDAIIISGSDYRIADRSSPKVPEIIFKYNIHILALCYGMQYIAVRFGKFSNVRTRDTGYIRNYDRMLKIRYPFDIVKTKYRYNHNDIVIKVGKNIDVVMKKKNMIDMLYHKKRDILGLQFHPEYYVKSGKLFYNAWLSWLSRRK